MKSILFLIISLALAVSVRAQTLSPSDEHSTVKFTIRNFGFNVTGSFKGLNGNLLFDSSDLARSVFDVSVEANTVNTGIDMRDEHLRGESYFDVKNYPRIHFVSSRFTRSNKAGTFFVFGKLTIKNTTKEISFPFTVQPQPDGYLFNGEFQINRRDFDVGGSGTLSNQLMVNLAVIAKK